MATSYAPGSPERVPTGIPGLDTILWGGFLRGSVNLIMGTPGTGKTVLANQMCYHHVAAGGRAVYVTLLAESHGNMIANLQSFQFFSAPPIGDTLNYLSGYRELEQGGLAGLQEFLWHAVRDHQATLLVLDGLAVAEAFAESSLAFRRFIYEFRVQTEVLGCTAVLLAPLNGNQPHPEHIMVDGLIELTSALAGMRAVRELQVLKLRGSEHLDGQHIFTISRRGLVVYPRTEAILPSPALVAGEDRTLMSFDIPRLDEMLRGGLLSGSTTMLLGSPGSGKTLLGLHFLTAGARRGEPCLYFGFFETPPRLIGKAEGTGLDFGRFVREDSIALIWQPAVEQIADAIAERMLEEVRRRGVRRLYIDGLNGLQQAAVYPARIPRFFTALTNELRGLNVTTLFSVETTHLFSPEVDVPITGVSAIVENIIFLRYAELRSQLYRLISILKVRESAYDTSIREFNITDQGIDVAATFESAEAILSGIPRVVGPGPVLRRRMRLPRTKGGQEP